MGLFLFSIQSVSAALQYFVYDDFNGTSLDLNKWNVNSKNGTLEPFQISNGILKIDTNINSCITWGEDNWSQGGCASELMFKNLSIPFGIKMPIKILQAESNLNGISFMGGIEIILGDELGNTWVTGINLGRANWNNTYTIGFGIYKAPERTPATGDLGYQITVDKFYEQSELTFEIDQENGKTVFRAFYNGNLIAPDINEKIDTTLGSGFRNKTFAVWNNYLQNQYWIDQGGVKSISQSSRAVMNIDRVELGKPSNSCTYGLNPTFANHSANAESGSFNITVTNSCNWSASSNQSWVKIINPSGNGNATISYNVDANPNTTIRSAIISINGQSFTVNQAAKTISLIPDIRIEPTTLNF